MNMLNKLICWFEGHAWHNDKHYPTHGWRDIPYKGSYCSKCGQQA